MDVKLAKTSREAALLLRREGLPAEEKDLVFDQQFTEAVDGILRQLLGERDALDDGAQGGGQAGDGDGHGAGIMTWVPVWARGYQSR
jgi:hypothetical protein